MTGFFDALTCYCWFAIAHAQTSQRSCFGPVPYAFDCNRSFFGLLPLKLWLVRHHQYNLFPVTHFTRPSPIYIISRRIAPFMCRYMWLHVLASCFFSLPLMIKPATKFRLTSPVSSAHVVFGQFQPTPICTISWLTMQRHVLIRDWTVTAPALTLCS